MTKGHASQEIERLLKEQGDKPHVPAKQKHEEAWKRALDAANKAIQSVEPVFYCGFAWIVIRPGNSGIASWLRKQDIGNKNYYGGWQVWSPIMVQSMNVHEAW